MGKPAFDEELTTARNKVSDITYLVKAIRKNHDVVTDGREDRQLEYASQLLTIAWDVLAEILERRNKKRMESTEL